MMILKKTCWCFSIEFYQLFYKFLQNDERKNATSPFMIMNTDRSDKERTYWWSILDLHSKKKIFLFDLIIQNDKNIINKILFRINNFNKNNDIINIVSVKFLVLNYE